LAKAHRAAGRRTSCAAPPTEAAGLRWPLWVRRG
jgi:hypothetical protein